eukprot:8728398-Ditylum_brightwellii.AAC.1
MIDLASSGLQCSSVMDELTEKGKVLTNPQTELFGLWTLLLGAFAALWKSVHHVLLTVLSQATYYAEAFTDIFDETLNHISSMAFVAN